MAAGDKATQRGWRRWLIARTPYIVTGIVLVAAFPALTAYAKSMVTQVLIYSVFAMGLNLLMGHLGLFSLGQAAFFGVGGYTTAVLLTKFGITSFWLTAAAGILAAGLVAAMLGIVVLRASGLYFLLITMAFGELLAGVASRWEAVTKGNNGIIGIRYPDLGLPFTIGETSFYYLVLAIAAICVFLMYRLSRSPFGRALHGIREDERLMQHLGYNTWLFKYVTFVVAGIFAGVAGILYAHFTSIFVPSNLSTVMSVMVALMVIIGSSSMIYGPIVGTTVVLFVQYYASVLAPAYWPMILGSSFVITVMFLRGGISTHLLRLSRACLWKLRRKGGPEHESSGR